MHNYCTPRIIKENFENFLIHGCNYIFLSQVYCVWQVVNIPTIILNNPVKRMRFTCWITKATHTHTHTHTICYIYCFFPATMDTRTRLNITWNVHCLLFMILNVERLFSDDEVRKKTAMIRSDLLCLRLVAALTYSSVHQRATWTAQKVREYRLAFYALWHLQVACSSASTAVCWYCSPTAGHVTKRRGSRTQFRCCSNHHYLVTVIHFPRTHGIQRRLLSCHHLLRVRQLPLTACGRHTRLIKSGRIYVSH